MDNIDSAVLIDLWTRMVRIRRFEERVSKLAADNVLPGYSHTYSGEEAVACGVIPLLRTDDWITSTYRNHGHSIARVFRWRVLPVSCTAELTECAQAKAARCTPSTSRSG